MRRIAHLALLLWLVTACSWQAFGESAQRAERPRVRLIATGGTIANRPGARLSATELILAVPELERYARPEAEQFTNVTSTALTLNQFLQLARRINELFDRRSDLMGVVVSSGTDTLEELAYFLHLTVRSNRPVVIVGSMRAPESLGYDGVTNLLEGFRVAADPASRGRGVLVVLNNEINSAREVTKTDAQRLQTFGSRDYGLLGVVDADRVVYYRSVDRRHTAASEFDVRRIDGLPRVDILLVYQDASGDLIRTVVDAGAKGLVIASAGAGGISGTQREAIVHTLGLGIPVVMSTRTGSGRVPPTLPGAVTEDGDSIGWSPNRIAGEDLAPVKARILLMLALTKTRDGREIQRMFLDY